MVSDGESGPSERAFCHGGSAAARAAAHRLCGRERPGGNVYIPLS